MTTGWAVRERANREDTQRSAEILAAARIAFEEHGFESTSMAQIAAKAAVSRATLYVYFESKKAILEALAEQLRDEYLAAQSVTAEATGSVTEVLSETVHHVLDATVKHWLLLKEVDRAAERDESIRQLWSSVKTAPVERAASYVRHAAESQQADPVVEAVHLAWIGSAANDHYAELVRSGVLSQPEAASVITTMWLTLVRPRAS